MKLPPRIRCIALRTILYLVYIAGGCLITNAFNDQPSFLDSLLFVFVTMTTVGYGNEIPDTDLGKCLVILFVLFGTILGSIFGNPVGDLVNWAGDKLEEWFFQAITATTNKNKAKWKFFFAIFWILFVIGFGITGIWFCDATEMQHNVLHATYFSVISAYTIGYGDYWFSASSGKLFALMWLPLGTAIVGTATSYICRHRRWICVICLREDRKPKSLAEVKTRIAFGQEFEKGTCVETNPKLRKYCLDLSEAATSLKYLSRILSSRVYEYNKSAQKGYLESAPTCSSECSTPSQQVKILLKREDCLENVISSYEWRGTYNFIVNAPIETTMRGLTCAFGKHAVIVAHLAQLLKLKAPMVVIPNADISHEQVVRQKLYTEMIRYKPNIVHHGDRIQDSEGYAKEVANDQRMTYVPQCDHSDIITAYGTIGMEIMNDLVRTGRVHLLYGIFVAVGDGNLIAGIAAYVKRVFPQVQIFGVEECSTSLLAWSLDKGERVLLEKQNGEVVQAIGEECFSICAELVDGVMVVDDEAILAAREHIRQDIPDKEVSALCIAGVQCYCQTYADKVRKKIVVAVIDE